MEQHDHGGWHTFKTPTDKSMKPKMLYWEVETEAVPDFKVGGFSFLGLNMAITSSESFLKLMFPDPAVLSKQLMLTATQTFPTASVHCYASLLFSSSS